MHRVLNKGKNKKRKNREQQDDSQTGAKIHGVKILRRSESDRRRMTALRGCARGLAERVEETVDGAIKIFVVAAQGIDFVDGV